MTTASLTEEALDTLLTIEEVMAVVKLGKTACREALRRPGAPAPVVFNARCHRWWASEVYAWLRRLQLPQTAPAMAASEPAPMVPSRRSTGGRPRKHTV
jgi:predicted DNA-binding transcriptional regulator AlpA